MIHFNNLSEYPIPFSDLKRVGEKILSEEGVPEAEEITCVFSDNEFIRSLNKKYRKRDEPTDVLAFSFTEGEDSEYRKHLFGEIYISVEMARENSKRYENTLMDELILLFIHGMLHLIGYNDESDSERGNMKERERYYLLNR
jgi:probable rRNA maturation factor